MSQTACERRRVFSLRCAGSTLAAISLATITPINEPIAR